MQYCEMTVRTLLRVHLVPFTAMGNRCIENFGNLSLRYCFTVFFLVELEEGKELVAKNTNILR